MNRSAQGTRKRTALSDDPRGGRLVAWAGFIFGSLVSVNGNWLASRIPPAGAAPDWVPTLWAQAWATVWPIALLLSVEALARVQWPGGRGWAFARFGGVGAVALFSAVISYGHIHGLLTTWGYDWRSATVGPLVIDGLMVVAGFALLAHHHPAGDEAGEPVVTSLDPELVKLARKLVDADPKVGRRVAAKELGVSEHTARQLLDHVRQTAPTTPPDAGESA